MKIVLVDRENFHDALEVYSCSWRESHKSVCTPEFMENRDYESFLVKKLGQLYLIFDGVLVGVFSLDESVLGDVYIHPAHQRKGYGTEAVRFAQLQSDHLRLTVLSNNDAAIHLYEKMGFRFTGQDVPLRNGLLEREMRYMEKHNG